MSSSIASDDRKDCADVAEDDVAFGLDRKRFVKQLCTPKRVSARPLTLADRLCMWKMREGWSRKEGRTSKVPGKEG